jgi:hypothetical protein
MSQIFKNITDFFSRDKKRLYLFVALAVCIILIVLSSIPESNTKQSTDSLYLYKTQLEDELTELCSSVRGVGRCTVTVSFSEGERHEYKGSSITGTTPPRVMGVTVVCDGGNKDSVRADVCELMRALFDIGSNRIAVLERK